jgi:hypothetical protein
VPRYEIDPDVAVWRLVDGEAVIIHAETSHYYLLNHSGTLVWTALAERPSDLTGLAEVVGRHYGQAAAAVRTDVESLLGDLLTEGLVRKSEAIDAESQEA